MRAILWCNGPLPSESLISDLANSVSLIFGIDGGADKASEMGYEVSKAIGDMDSVVLSNWEGKVVFLEDQNKSDLSKSISYVNSLGVNEVDVVGVEGGDYGHVFGAFAALNEAPVGMKIRLHYESGVMHLVSPSNGGFNEVIHRGQKFSVFALTPCKVMDVIGGKWELRGRQLSMSTRGLSNEGLGDSVSVTSDGIAAVYTERS